MENNADVDWRERMFLVQRETSTMSMSNNSAGNHQLKAFVHRQIFEVNDPFSYKYIDSSGLIPYTIALKRLLQIHITPEDFCREHQ